MSDLISRAEVHKTLSLLATEGGTDAKMLLSDAHEFIDALPSADAEHTDCTDFINWLLEVVMYEEMWELNAVAYGEIIARKLEKLGLLETKDGYYIRHIENNTKESDLVYRPSAEAVHKPDYSYEAGMARRLKEALSAEAEDRLYIKIYADDEPSVKAEKLYQICGETQNREVAEWLKEYFSLAEWIPCSERLPKENEYVGNVCKYYLIQDEYGDMHVAHLSGRGWETIESVKALGCDVIAWMPLPKPYREDGEA